MARVFTIITIALLAIGSIGGAFFYHDSVKKSASLSRNAEKIESLTRKISELDTYLENFRKKAGEDERLIERLQDELETMRHLKVSLQDETSVNEAVRREIKECRNAKASIETYLEAEKASALALGMKLKTLRNQIMVLEEKIEAKNRALALSQAEFVELKAEKISAREEADQKIAGLYEILSARDTELQTTRDTIKDQEDRIDSLSRSLEELDTRILKTEEEIQRHLMGLKKAGVEIKAKEAQISYLLEEIRKTEDEAARRNAQLKRRIQEKEMQIEKARAQVLSLRGQVEQDKNTQAFLGKKFFKLHEQKDKERIDVEEQIAQLEARLDEKNSNLEEKRRQLEEKDQQIRTIQTENISLQAVVEAGRITREILNKKYFDLEKSIAAEKEMRKTISAELSALMANNVEEQEAIEKRIAYLKDTLAERDARNAESQTEIGSLKNQIENDKTELLFLKESVSDLHRQLRREQLEAAQRNAQLKKLSREKELQLEKATVQLLKIREAIEEVIGTRSAMEDQVSALKSEGQANINQLVKQLDEKVQEKDRQLDDMVKEVDKWRVLYEDLEGALNLSRDQLKTFENLAAKNREEKGAVEHRLKDMGATYNALIDTLRSKLESKEATIKEYREKLTLTFVNKILFGRAAVRISSDGKRVLRKTGEGLKNIPYGKIRIVGHTDSDPIRSKYRRIYPSNWELSSARAAAVARFFQKTVGIDPERMEIIGMAFTQPVADNETKEGKARNRRVEVIIVPMP